MTIATHNFRQGHITNKSPGSPINEQREEEEERQDSPVSLNLNLTL